MSFFYHPGVMMARHGVSESNWYQEHGCAVTFTTALKHNGYIVCGNSGGRAYAVENGEIIQSSKICSGPEYTCAFVGFSCRRMLPRRWSCCGREVKGTLLELAELVGCVGEGSPAEHKRILQAFAVKMKGNAE